MKKFLLPFLIVLALSISSASHAASVTQIVGANVAVPVLGPSASAIICTPPAWCPTFFDNHKTTGGRYYGDAFSSAGGFSNECHISTDSGGSWTTTCAGAYPTANIPREMDVTRNNVLLSLRYESGANNICRLDRSTDDGATWTTITVAAGAGFSCLGHNAGYLMERQRCNESSCFVLVNTAGVSHDIYRSNDEGANWSLAHVGVQFWIPGELFLTGSTGIFSVVSGGDDTATTTDGGTTWANKAGDVAGTTNCGGSASRVTGPALGGIAIGCIQFPTVGFTLLNAAATLGFNPSQPSGYTYLTTSMAAVRSRVTGHVYFNAVTSTPTRGRLFESINGGSTFTEMAASVSGAIDPIQNHNARDAGRNLIFSTNGGSSFAATQIMRISGGE